MSPQGWGWGWKPNSLAPGLGLCGPLLFPLTLNGAQLPCYGLSEAWHVETHPLPHSDISPLLLQLTPLTGLGFGGASIQRLAE